MSSVDGRRRADVIIPSAGSLSNAIDVVDRWLVGLIVPSAWTAANITFEASQDGVTFHDLVDINGIEVQITATADTFVVLSPEDFGGALHIKVRSGTSSTPVVQAAERTILLSMLPV